MCGQYAIVSSIERIEKKFNVKQEPELAFSVNRIVIPGNQGLVITDNEPRLIQSFTFGFTPSWSKKATYIINARSEGDHNKENRMDYNGAKGIITKPFFRKAIRQQRCLVIADCFLEGPTKERLKKPFAVYMKNYERPFAFAGIWDSWKNPDTGKVMNTFAIITSPANKLLAKIPHHRMPVILSPSSYSRYLSTSRPLSDITELLVPYPYEAMNAFPISPAYKKHYDDARLALHPIGQRLEKEYDFKVNEEIKLFGMGELPSRELRDRKANN
ncbi:MAG: SOS response-associated peptidase [Bacteroidales bacterium]|nr:SOS response-associated peptidase [Bacteroidales bacterium]